MSPLIELEPEEFEYIAQAVHGGAANIQDVYPLTALQEGILFHHVLGGQGDTYIVLTSLEFQSRTRLDAFIAALQQVIDRHDALRTAVLWEQLRQPVQVVCRTATLAVEVLELDAERDVIEQLTERMKPEWQRLDIRRAPLMRLQIAADARRPQCHALLQFHHLVCDGISVQIVFAEVAAFLQGRASQLLAPVQYREHVAHALVQERSHDPENFFRSKLAEFREPSAPFGLIDVHGDGSRIEEARLTLEPALAERVRAQARRHRVSAAALFHAAWALVVAHTSGRNDVVFGTVLFGRLYNAGKSQQKVGLFLNSLPVRLRLKDLPTHELLKQTQRELTDLLLYEQASLAVARRCSGIEGALPLFSTLLNYRYASRNMDAQLADHSSGVRVLVRQMWTNYPIAIAVDDYGDEFVLIAQTDRRIDPHRIADYTAVAIQSLVEALENAPQTPSLALSILPARERHQLMELFNATQVDYLRDKRICEWFDEQVERTPDALAVVYEAESLTYADLRRKVDRLAWYLTKKGVGSDQRVALCMERSVEMVIGLLGILKAGGACVPLDPSYPSAFLAYVLSDAAPVVLLTQERLRKKLPHTVARVIAVDDVPALY